MPYDKTKDPSFGETGATVPAKSAYVVTPHDANDLPRYPKALRVGGAGNLKFLPSRNADADPITIPVSAGEVVPVQARRVFATGTTATSILALLD